MTGLAREIPVVVIAGGIMIIVMTARMIVASIANRNLVSHHKQVVGHDGLRGVKYHG
jgi:hypothetical protein